MKQSRMLWQGSKGTMIFTNIIDDSIGGLSINKFVQYQTGFPIICY